MSKINIATNSYYDISYETLKNRFYLNIKGFWPNKDVVKNYVADWQEAFRLSKPRFTLITDITAAKTHPKEIMELCANTCKSWL